MKLIAGLGNPGPRYEHTRHNVGFVVVDELARRWAASADYDRSFEAVCGVAQIGAERVLLLKPQTLMNLSGRSVNAALRFYKMGASDLLILMDDLDLAVGQLRVRAGGSPGGHRGLSDVIQRLGSQELARVRIGIGRVHRSETVDYVLGRFAPDERAPIADAVQRAADAAECWVREGVTAAMNRFNARPRSDGEQN